MASRKSFTAAEKKYFTTIIKKFSRLIENRDTDGATLRIKNEAWNKVTAEFNASPLATSQATQKQLRRLWMNLKQRQRDALTKERQHRLATGGGPSIEDVEINPDILAAAPALIVGIDAAIDSDTLQELHIIPAPAHAEQVIVIANAPSIPKQASQSINLPEDNLIPPTSTSSNQPSSVQTKKSLLCANVMEHQYKDRKKRADEKHSLEMLVLQQQLREATAKADLAELILEQKHNCQDQTSD